jgi:hypothetical protein
LALVDGIFTHPFQPAGLRVYGTSGLLIQDLRFVPTKMFLKILVEVVGLEPTT